MRLVVFLAILVLFWFGWVIFLIFNPDFFERDKAQEKSGRMSFSEREIEERVGELGQEAKAAFDKGDKLFGEKKYAEAAPFFRESVDKIPTL